MTLGSDLFPDAPDPGAAPGSTERATRKATINVAASVVGQVVGKLSTLAWTLVAARVLTTSEFGAFFYALALAGLASAVAEWGFDPVLMERVARDPRSVNAHYTRAQLLQTVIAVPAFAIAAALAYFSTESPSNRVALVLVTGAVVLDLWTDTARSTGAALRDQIPGSRALVVQRMSTAALAIGILLAGGGLLGLGAAFFAGSALGVLAHLGSLRVLGVRLDRTAADRASLAAAFRDTAMIGVTVIVLMALFRLDVVILDAFKDEVAVGAYGVSYRLFESTLFVTYSVQGAVFPLMSAARRPADVAAHLERAVLAVAALYLPVGVVLAVDARGILDLLYGDRYVDVSSGALQWLAFAPVVYAIAYLGSSALQAVTRRRAMLLAALAALVVNVAVNLVAVPRLSGTGAALATTASYAVEAVVAVAVLWRVGVRPSAVRALVPPMVAAGACAALLAALPLPVVAEAPLALLAVGAGWLLVLARRHPERLMGLKRRLIRHPG